MNWAIAAIIVFVVIIVLVSVGICVDQEIIEWEILCWISILAYLIFFVAVVYLSGFHPFAILFFGLLTIYGVTQCLEIGNRKPKPDPIFDETMELLEKLTKLCEESLTCKIE